MTNEKIAPDAVYRVLINAPIDTVWAALIRQDHPLPFFFGSVCHSPGLAPGAPIRMRSPNGKYTSVAGDVTVFEPPYKYGHSFRFTNLEEPACHVTYELRETPDGVEFTLTTSNVAVGSKTEQSMAQGGPFITTNLKSYAETGSVTFSGKLILIMIALMTPFTPKTCQSSHWPFTRKI